MHSDVLQRVISAHQVRTERKGRNTVAGGGALLVAALVASYVWHNAGFFFEPGHAEFGDYANNAIRITNAKAFREIYGNYSRWGFYHPGPAFFYVYGFGEYVFYEWVKIAGSPQAAHFLAGLILQCSFVVTALWYLFERLSLLSVLPLALATLVLHWHFMHGGPLSLWPPHVLFGPVVALLVFAAGLASGDHRAVLGVVIASCFLIHGHVGQPLFVVPIVTLSASVWVWRSWPIDRSVLPVLAGAVLIIAVFALPLLIDMAKGKESNFAAILRHVETHHGERHTLAQGFGYVLSFFEYQMGQESVQGSASFSLRQYLWGHKPVYLIPMAACVGAALGLFGVYLRWLPAFVTMGFLLALIWATTQDGEMYDFNGYYIHALIFIAYTVTVAVAATWIVRIPAPVVTIVSVLIFVVAATRLSNSPFTFTVKTDAMESAVKAVSAQHRSVCVTFDGKFWNEAFAVINLLNRNGTDWRVRDGYKFLYIQQPAEKFDGAVYEIGVSPSEWPLINMGGVQTYLYPGASC
jgi:hypothetical protein